ncbi:hypothetical protein ABWED_2385 [Acinetobacter lwoffii]|nr:hypothetical protein ABEKA_0053 [Acinetobacter lwoffii]QZM12888.1 hypothetical protein ABVS_2237 [Acinetobacter lwoffii]UHT65684.1 hypothetical protein ABEDC_2513 [Acinetobacter lwoffii]UVB01640.1 hypothetical protein ABWED_2385 [Acinetobacter lwoffii]
MKILAAIQNFPVHWTYCFSSKGQQKFVDASPNFCTLYPI